MIATIQEIGKVEVTRRNRYPAPAHEVAQGSFKVTKIKHRLDKSLRSLEVMSDTKSSNKSPYSKRLKPDTVRALKPP